MSSTLLFPSIAEGVELLCLVDKGVEACRYLQTYGQWDLATWLAKVGIDYFNQGLIPMMEKYLPFLQRNLRIEFFLSLFYLFIISSMLLLEQLLVGTNLNIARKI